MNQLVRWIQIKSKLKPKTILYVAATGLALPILISVIVAATVAILDRNMLRVR